MSKNPIAAHQWAARFLAAPDPQKVNFLPGEETCHPAELILSVIMKSPDAPWSETQTKALSRHTGLLDQERYTHAYIFALHQNKPVLADYIQTRFDEPYDRRLLAHMIAAVNLNFNGQSATVGQRQALTVLAEKALSKFHAAYEVCQREFKSGGLLGSREQQQRYEYASETLLVMVQRHDLLDTLSFPLVDPWLSYLQNSHRVRNGLDEETQKTQQWAQSAQARLRLRQVASSVSDTSPVPKSPAPKF